MNPRRVCKPIQIGNVTIGGSTPIVVQSMTKTDTRDVMSTICQIKELEDCGCELVRVAVPDTEAAQAIQAIKRGVSIPIIADIHFDYRLALMALEAGADGLRLNPGNIGEPERVSAVAQAAKEIALGEAGIAYVEAVKQRSVESSKTEFTIDPEKKPTPKLKGQEKLSETVQELPELASIEDVIYGRGDGLGRRVKLSTLR